MARRSGLFIFAGVYSFSTKIAFISVLFGLGEDREKGTAVGVLAHQAACIVTAVFTQGILLQLRTWSESRYRGSSEEA